MTDNSHQMLTTVREVWTNLFNSRAKEPRSQALVGNVSNHGRQAFQHLRSDDCRRLR